jgi:hypothetical protein
MARTLKDHSLNVFNMPEYHGIEEWVDIEKEWHKTQARTLMLSF